MALRTAVVVCFILCPIIVEPTRLIDRKSVVERHTIKFEGVVTTTEKQGSSPLTLAVGNGMIAFNADITGFQTLTKHTKFFHSQRSLIGDGTQHLHHQVQINRLPSPLTSIDIITLHHHLQTITRLETEIGAKPEKFHIQPTYPNLLKMAVLGCERIRID